MLDPLTAMSVAANVVQFVTFAGQIISKTNALSKSADGQFTESLELELLTKKLETEVITIADAERRTERASEDKDDEPDEDLLKLCQGCRAVAQELLGAIAKLKVQGEHTTWNCFRQALANYWGEKKLVALARRLDSFRKQIDTTLLVSLVRNVESLTFLKSKESHLQTSIQSELALQAQDTVHEMRQWQKDIINNVLSNRSISALSSRLDVGSQQQWEDTVKFQFLDSLHFDNMDDRVNGIPKAYVKTFDWIFQQDSRNSSGEGSIIRWHDFPAWLSNDEPLYWIAGKPGSGKSTLMKYLNDHPQTSTLLKSWSRIHPVKVAGFFFWNSGTAMQHSEISLYKSLLRQILVDQPDIIPLVFPERWQRSHRLGKDMHPYPLFELRSALKTLLTESAKNLVFFIDGMDEFGGNQADLASFLIELASGSKLKICVASRPWLVFEEAFHNRPSLLLENLTHDDINTFVRGNLGGSRNYSNLQRQKPADAEALVFNITSKARGVFLWVILVVRSLLEGLRDGDKISNLQTRLTLLPSDLGELFKGILDSIGKNYTAQASEIFQIMIASIKQDKGVIERQLSLLQFSFAHDGYEVAMAASVTPLNHDDREVLYETMRRRLNSRCKGLLEAPMYKSDREKATVQYLHRTVKDYFFLQGSAAQKFLLENAGDFDPNIALCAGYLRELKATASDRSTTPVSFVPSLKACIHFSNRFEISKPESQAKILDELAEVFYVYWCTRINIEIYFETEIADRILQIVARNRDCERVKYLLKDGFSPNTSGEDKTPVWEAILKDLSETSQQGPTYPIEMIRDFLTYGAYDHLKLLFTTKSVYEILGDAYPYEWKETAIQEAAMRSTAQEPKKHKSKNPLRLVKGLIKRG